jgi:multiple sugar transport system ATP-binding protein
MTMGDRVAVMRKGELQQVAHPKDLYDHPVNLFVGGFIGSPSMNLIDATLESRNGGLATKVGSHELALDPETLKKRPGLHGYEGRTVVLGIRPEDLEDAALATDTPPDRRLKGEVVLTEALGSEIMAHIQIDAQAALTDDVRELAVAVGDDVGAGLPAAERDPHAVIVGRFNARSQVAEGQTTEIAVDTRSLHFFDPETGLGIYEQAPATKGDA